MYKGSKIIGTTRADQLRTTQNITIAGGPLANELKEVFPDGIPSGTSLQDLLLALACQEQWPNPEASASYGTLTTTMYAPVVTTPEWHNTVVEVGQSLSIGKVSAKNATSNIPALTFDNFAYGYENSEGSYEAETQENNPPAVNATVSTASVTYSLGKTYTGFGKTSADNITDSAADATALSFNEESLPVELGSNSVVYTLSVDKAIHSAAVQAPEVYFAKSNLGNTNDKSGSVVQVVDMTTIYNYTTGKPAAKSTSTFKVTGVYPVYNNINGNYLTEAAENKMPLVSSSIFEVEYPAEGAYRVAFAYPADRVMQSVEVYNPMTAAGPNKGWEPYGGGSSETEESVSRTINGKDVKYKTWLRVDENANDSIKYRFTLSVATNA